MRDRSSGLGLGGRVRASRPPVPPEWPIQDQVFMGVANWSCDGLADRPAS